MLEDKLTHYQCDFVLSSEVFQDCPRVWDAFCNSEPDCSWGDNARTLVTVKTVLDVVKGLTVNDVIVLGGGGDGTEEHELLTVHERLQSLAATQYIDMEN